MSEPPIIPVKQPIDIHLPKEVEALYDLAHNLWWTWNPEAKRLFSAIDRWSWARHENPVELLHSMDREHLDDLVEDQTLLESLSAVLRSFVEYRQSSDESWFRRHYPQLEAGPIAYFSMEYGLHQSLPIYSGGLGVLSGDHCKSASDLGLPFVAVGLLYRAGYFQQSIDADGWQQQTYPECEFERLGVRPVATRTGGDLLVEVPFPGREVIAKVWLLEIGRVPLLLLDTDVRQNDPADRPITSVLYVRGREMRLAQELVLGVGGARALAALDIEPAVWHLNEGHSSLLQLERLRVELPRSGGDLGAATARLARNSAFTTHTPVPAGHETFEPELAEKYLDPWAELLGISRDRLMALGQAAPGSADRSLNLTALALRTTGFANGVSRRNAEVSRRSLRHLLPEAMPRRRRRRIEAITNGVHVPTWIGVEIRHLLERQLGPSWLRELGTNGIVEAVERIPDEELWRAHHEQKVRLARFARARLRSQYARHGRSPDALRAVEELFDVEVLTLGFARRFATYKRASLLFSDLDRARALLADPERPVQLVLAGKAHPADRPGQELIRKIFNLGQDEHLRGRIFFLENYDIGIAQKLVQGVDVWLNTPRPPLEASGTSGMKAAINGVLNCSVLDGWWPEGFDGSNGWAIDGGEHGDEETQDREDALALYETLERRIVPTFYQRDDDALPREWLAMMRRSIATIAPRFASNRMVREYVEHAYAPLFEATPGPAVAAERDA